MKKIESYTIEEIDEIWREMKPGNVTKAYTLMKLKCEYFQKIIKNNNHEKKSN